MDLAVVNTPIKSIYLTAEKNSELSDEILYGMSVKIINRISNDKIYIKTEYDYEGYVDNNDLLFDDKLISNWKCKRNAIVINNFADILEKPNISSKIIKCLPLGSSIIATNIMSTDRNWCKVELVDSSTGWIKSSFLRYIEDIKKLILNETNFRESLINDSHLFLGTQYRWGGKTAFGIDCSGLCSMVYMINGIKIYRDAKIKDNFPIKSIPIKKAKKGDLLFFPGHVAMYLGENKFIHSSNTNNIVRINSLNCWDDDYREDLAKTLITAGTIFTN
ncbi:SH3 domain-containing C40 family peptidase [Clostridioides difficile]